jgi:fluoroacetyl-CoA thioesterase
VELLTVEGRKLVFAIEAHDGLDLIASGTHERHTINREKFDAKWLAKLKASLC